MHKRIGVILDIADIGVTWRQIMSLLSQIKDYTSAAFVFVVVDKSTFLELDRYGS